MQEMKDTAIKLFGRTIPLLLSDRAAEGAAISGEDSAGVSHTCGGGGGGGDIEDMMRSFDYDRPSMIVCSEEEDEKKKAGEIQEKADNKDLLEGEFSEVQRQDNAPQPVKGDSTTQETFKETNENPRTPSIDVETATINISKTEKEQNDTTDSQEKTLQKPDKIIPCPRCNSMDTKFCYYNNYNVHQPRYFCKSCQRYWTAGGTMRNVPVGAGRRKNKNAAISHYGHITISEAVHAARIDAPNGVHHPALKCNGTVLRFGSDASLSNSVASALNLNENTLWNGTRNGFHKMEEQIIQDPNSVRENGDNHSCGSSVTATNSTEEGSRNCAQQAFMPNFNGFAPQIQCLPGVPWPYPWNSAVPPPAFCPPGMPIPFYPAGYWNCTIPGTWNNVPWIPSPNQNAQSPGPNSQTLGKHSRDADVLEPEKEEPQRQKKSESCIWIPKTLRIDDPEEAAKSSIWTTLGIKNESNSKGGLFKAFQPKTFEKNHVAESSPALRANPAALSRSINFHERS